MSRMAGVIYRYMVDICEETWIVMWFSHSMDAQPSFNLFHSGISHFSLRCRSNNVLNAHLNLIGHKYG